MNQNSRDMLDVARGRRELLGRRRYLQYGTVTGRRDSPGADSAYLQIPRHRLIIADARSSSALPYLADSCIY